MKNSVALLPLCVSLFVLFAPTADAQTLCTSVTLSRTSFYAGYKSAYWSVKVTTPTPDCAWEVTINRGTQDTSAWLLLNDKPEAMSASGVGTGTFALRTLVNNTGAWRYGAVTIAGITYKVTQERQADTVPPTVSLVAPPANATVAATIEIAAIAGDNVGVKGVQFKVDGVNLGAEDLAAPYSAIWDTTLVNDGPHTVTAVVRDAVGNTSTASATALVNNIPDPPPPPDPPVAVTNVAPVHGATGVALPPTLSWTQTNATSYSVRVATANPPTAVAVENHTATAFVATGLAHGTTYYWQVTAKNSGGETASAIWSFTTAAASDPDPTEPPASPVVTLPADTSLVDVNQTLAWTATGATSYQLKIGTANPPTELTVDTVTPTHAPALAYGTTYYWQVVAKNSVGETTGPVWSFTTNATPPPPPAPNAPTLVGPVNGSTVPLTQVLSWSATGATTYSLKLSTSNPPTDSPIELTNATHAPTLAYGTTYYWQVVASNASGSTAGPIWSFSTEAAPAPAPPANNTLLKRLRVISWNAQFGYSVGGQHDYQNQLDLLASLNPDVIVLQEVTLADFDMPVTYERGLESRTGKDWSAMFVQSIAGAARANAQGNMILTWLPVDQALAKVVCAEPNDTRPPSESSCTAFVSYAVTVNSVPLTISGIHLNVRSASYRSYQMGELVPWLDTFGPHRIVAGDFNLEPLDPLWANWAVSYADVWAGVVGATGDLGFTKDQRTFTNLPGRIDYTFIGRASTRIAVQSFAVVKTTLSDHHLLVGDYIIR